jgi:hypothetical protein
MPVEHWPRRMACPQLTTDTYYELLASSFVLQESKSVKLASYDPQTPDVLEAGS